MPLHHRLYYICVLVIGLIVTVLGMSVTALLVCLNLPSVQHYAEKKLPSLTGNMVHLEGISGFLPSHVSIQKLTLNDEKGVWLELDKADLRWSPLSLIHLKAKVKKFSAERFVFERLPYSIEPSPPSDPNDKPIYLPLSVDVRSLTASHIEIGESLTQKRLLLSLSGKAKISSINPFIQGVSFKNSPSIMIDAVAKRFDEPAELTVKLDKSKRRATGSITFHEGNDGFLSTMLHMPALDPLSVTVNFKGPFRRLQTQIALTAGHDPESQLKLNESGHVNLYKKKGKLNLTASSPAMTVLPELAWDHLDVKALLSGSFMAPGGEASIQLANLSAFSLKAHSIDVHFKGDHKKHSHKNVQLSLTSVIKGLRLPGGAPLLLASSPVTLEAHYLPFQKTQPFTVKLQHKLLDLSVNGTVKPSLTGHLDLSLPKLQPFAKMGNVALEGHSHLTLDMLPSQTKEETLKAFLKGDVHILSGLPQAVGLVGNKGQFSTEIKRNARGTFQLSDINISGQAFKLEGNSSFNPDGKGALSAALLLSLPDLKAVYPLMHGHLKAEISTDGSLDDFKSGLKIDSVIGVSSAKTHIAPGPLKLNAEIAHLPHFPEGDVSLQGTLDNAPLAFDLSFHKDQKGTMSAILNKLDWKTLKGHGSIELPAGKKLPRGDMDITLSKLESFSSLIGQPVKGNFSLGLHSVKQKNDHATEEVHLDLKSQLGMADYAVRSFMMSGDVGHLSSDPFFDLSAKIDGLKIKDIKGDARLSLKGPQKALGLNLSGKFDNVLQEPARLDMAILANVPGSQLAVTKLDGLVKGETLRLQSPMTLHYGTLLSIEHFKLLASSAKSTPALISVNGNIKPKLALTFALDHVTPALAAPFVEGLKGGGQINAKGKLGGTLTDPTGNVTAEGENLYLNMGYAASLPRSSFSLRANLAHKQAQVQFDAKTGEKLSAHVKGAVPLSTEGDLSVHSTAKLNLTLLNAVLGSSGMGLKGIVDMDMTAQGTVKHPKLSGGIHLQGGDFTHYAQGVHLTDIKGDLIAQDDWMKIKDFSLKAGKGTMSLSGQIGVLRPGIPLDLMFSMNKAQPLISDMLMETLDSSIHVHGQAQSEINVDGSIKIPEASINIPDSMPTSVPQLKIIKPQTEEQQKPEPHVIVNLNMDVTSPGQLFVRGHGIFAEMSGKLHLRGTNLAPEITGGFDLRRGSFNLAGISLNFTKGRVAFNGSGVGHKLDPTLDFRADRVAEGITASLLVSGYASEPKLDFVSSPQRPKDEVLSVLLFGSTRASLSPTQLASLGAAVVQLGGGSSFDPLSVVRNGLGLDELSVGSSSGGKEGKEKTTISAGKYIMKNVYVGAKEGLSGNNTQAEVRVDITKHLKFNTTVGTGGQITGFTTPENDPGSSLGLSYGIDY